MGILTVVKRDGRIEQLDIKKIQKYTSAAVEGLSGVNQSELEVDAQIHFKNMISTADIQTTLIKTAIDKIDIDTPNWTFVAARLFLYDLYHKVSSFTGYKHLRDYLELGIRLGKILRGFSDKFDIDYLNSKIDPNRDLQFTYLGIKTLYDRYLLKDNDGKPIELPQHMFMAISMYLASNEKDCNEWAIKFYDVISKFEIMVATPTLANARTPRHQLSSCYIGSMPDNIEGIFDSYKEMALLSKYGGGIGYDVSKIRALGSSIDGHINSAGGVIPFLKIVNDVAVAVDQLGTRKGAIATYLEVWHKDILDFIDLRKNSGEERRRTHDLFPAVWICDLFMQRVESNSTWSLFDPYYVGELTELYGEEFNSKYIEFEKNANIPKVSINAKELWKRILTNYFESGLPFLGFKDTANRANPNSHNGIIRSSNLCTEIFQNTEPTDYVIKLTLLDGEKEVIQSYCENDVVTLKNGVIKKVNKLNYGNVLSDNKKVILVDKIPSQNIGKTAVCNLASLNLSKVHTKEDINRVTPIAVRLLDNVIDLNYYPTNKTAYTNKATRSIGLGVMGESEMLATNKIIWGSKEHFFKIDEIMELISFNTILTSSLLAKEKGVYDDFNGSSWSKGIFPIDVAPLPSKNIISRPHTCNWDELRNMVKENGLRNGYLMAIAPTSAISIVVGTTQTIEPIYRKKWFEENLSGVIPTVVPNLNLDTINYYISAYDINQQELIKAAAIRQKWIDQGQSINIFMTLDKASGKVLNDIYMLAWKLGIKSTYYLRTESPDAQKDDAIADRSLECYNCQ